MAKLIIGNWGNEAEMADMTPAALRHAGSQSQRLLWDARPGDVLLLPFEPDRDFLRYATALLGFDADTLTIMIAPAGSGRPVLTRDRFEDDAFVTRLRALLRDHDVDEVDAFYFDTSVNRLIRRLGLDKSTPGFGFVEQGGNELLNSKVMFRMVAAGTNLPVPEGIVTDSPDEATEFLWSMLHSGRPAIAKQNGGTAGVGNEIISPTGTIEALGALHHRVIDDRAVLADHVAKRWSWYTHGLRQRAVFEEYLAGSVPIWGEVAISEQCVRTYGYGRISMHPVCDGVMIPVPQPESDTPAFHAFLTHLSALGETLRGMGYRGLVNIDAILTPDGRVLFNEFNGRHGGSTHLFGIGERVLGGDYLRDRFLVEQRENAFPAFDVTLRALTERGIAYDPATRTGVIIPVYGSAMDGTRGEACIVGETLAAAEATQRELLALFPN